jgi:hypothetical protein
MFAQNTNPNRLKGDFPFNETLQIIIGGTQGGSCPNVLTGPVTQSTLTNTGIWSFDGKGNVSIVDQGMLVQIPSTDASQVTPSNAVCTGTYALLDANTVDFHYNCSTVPGTVFSSAHNWQDHSKQYSGRGLSPGGRIAGRSSLLRREHDRRLHVRGGEHGDQPNGKWSVRKLQLVTKQKPPEHNTRGLFVCDSSDTGYSRAMA